MRSSFRLFSDTQLEEIHRASLAVLERDGVRVQDPEAVDLLRQAGCEIGDNERVRIPSEIIEQALVSAPQQIDLFSRTGELRMELGRGNTYFGPGPDLTHTLDLVGSERRPSVLADVTAYSKLCDSLENIDFVMSMARGSDLSERTWDPRAFVEMLENTVKPIVFTAGGVKALGEIVQMAELTAGSVKGLVAKPFLMALLKPAQKLVLAADEVARLNLLVDKGLPWVVAPTFIHADPLPNSTQASVVEANAHALGVLTLAQLRRPGSPVVLGAAAWSGSQNMHHGLGMTELIHHRYGLPVWTVAGVSGSKLPDIQAGIDSALSIFAATSSGADLVMGAGSLESGEMGSFEMVVIADEIIGFVRQLMDGGQNPQPGLFDGKNHQGWVESGRPNMIRSARDKAIEAIGSHASAPLPESIAAELRGILEAADLHSDEDD